MFRTMMTPKMKGTVTRVRKTMGSIPADDTPTIIAIAVPATIMSVHATPSTGCLMTAGEAVRGHRSKQSKRNITTSAVT